MVNIQLFKCEYYFSKYRSYGVKLMTLDIVFNTNTCGFLNVVKCYLLKCFRKIQIQQVEHNARQDEENECLGLRTQNIVNSFNVNGIEH